MVAHAIVTLKSFTHFPINFYIGFHFAFKSSKNLYLFFTGNTCFSQNIWFNKRFSRVINVFHQNVQVIFVFMQLYVILYKNKKPDSYESGFFGGIKSLLSYPTFRHSYPDSRKQTLISFFTIIICAKSCHFFNYLIFSLQNYNINTK